jgi:hypothetical protein
MKAPPRNHTRLAFGHDEVEIAQRRVLDPALEELIEIVADLAIDADTQGRAADQPHPEAASVDDVEQPDIVEQLRDVERIDVLTTGQHGAIRGHTAPILV